MKYITTDKHPELKEGLILECEDNQPDCIFHDNGTYIESSIITGICYGYIEEVEEKEFTKSDMIDFAIWYDNDMMSKMSEHHILNEWLEQRQ